MHLNAREQRKNTGILFAEIVAVIAAGGELAPFYNIMVAIKHIKPVGFIKLGHHPIGVAVSLNNRLNFPVFPKLVAVSQLNIGEAVIIIIF